jgi:hypothetical protein
MGYSMVYTTYKNLNALVKQPSYANPPSEYIYSPTQNFSGLAGTMRKRFVLYPAFKTKNLFSFTSTQDYADFNKLFDYSSGRFGKLWVPSWGDDIRLEQNITAGDTYIIIHDIDYNTYYPEVPGTGRYLFFFKNNSTWEMNMVSSITGVNQLNMEDAFVNSYAMSQIKYISFLYLARFDIDQIEWEFLSPLGDPMVARTTIDFIELPNEYSLL